MVPFLAFPYTETIYALAVTILIGVGITATLGGMVSLLASKGMGGNAITYLGYSCIVVTIALFWFGLPNRSGESPWWLRRGPAQTLFPVFLMASFIIGVIMIVGIGTGTGPKPF